MQSKTQLAILFILAGLTFGSFQYIQRLRAGVDSVAGDVAPALKAILAQYTEPAQFAVPTKVTGCQVRGPLPDPECTPGAIFPEATVDVICVIGYTKTVRNVSVSLKRRIYTAYGLAYPQPSGTYEADHLIPLELGGNNDFANLFPEVATPKPGFREKDLVENFLHNEVCAGKIRLASAQQQIARDWVSVYKTLTPVQIDFLKRQYLN